MHHLFRSAQRQQLLEATAAAGITHFDTAPYYGYGLAEADLGVFLRGRRAEFTVTTKVGLYPWGVPSAHAVSVWSRKALGKLVPVVSAPVVNWQVSRARVSLRRSLRRLRTDYVDFVLLHEPDAGLMETDEFCRWIESEHARGTVRSWGVGGRAERVAPFALANHPLSRVVQTQDSLDQRQADFMFGCGRSLQFTYGYLASAHQGGRAETPERVVREALQRNRTGSILVSTRRVERIIELAKEAD